jgi:type IV secretory pathway VirB10-like protein
MRPTTAAFVLVVAAASLGAGGCSFAFVDRYHEPAHPGDAVHCTSSHKLALIDGAVAVAMYAASIYLSRNPDPDYPLYVGSVAGGVGVGFGVSALYGVYNVHKCRDGIAAARAPAADVPPAPADVPAEAAPVPAPAAAEPPPSAPATEEPPAAAEDEDAAKPAPKAKPAPSHKKHKRKKKK